MKPEIPGTNNWTPEIYTTPENPINWTAERNKSYAMGGGCKQSYGVTNKVNKDLTKG